MKLNPQIYDVLAEPLFLGSHQLCLRLRQLSSWLHPVPGWDACCTPL
uniref:Uncharacterized protein n=1 Tax=Arundo donax TaxID=35708 RepID=A0A0A9C2T1_ARUDO